MFAIFLIVRLILIIINVFVKTICTGAFEPIKEEIIYDTFCSRRSLSDIIAINSEFVGFPLLLCIV